MNNTWVTKEFLEQRQKEYNTYGISKENGVLYIGGLGISIYIVERHCIKHGESYKEIIKSKWNARKLKIQLNNELKNKQVDKKKVSKI